VSSLIRPNPNIPSIPQPVADIGALTVVTQFLKQGVDSLAGSRGKPGDRAVTFNDLVSIGLTGIPGPPGPPGAVPSVLNISSLTASGAAHVGSLVSTGAAQVGLLVSTGAAQVDSLTVSKAAKVGALTALGSLTGALIGDGSGGLFKSQPAGFDANAIYRMCTSALVTNYDELRAVVTNQPGSTITNACAVSGYVVNNAPSGGDTVAAASAVALFGIGVSAVDNAASWGMNVILTDNTAPVVSTGAGRVLFGAELDFNVTSPHTLVIGTSLIGASLTAPSLAIAHQVYPLGPGIPWTVSFLSQDGGAINALIAGQQGSGASQPSQGIILTAVNVNNVRIPVGIQQAIDGTLTFAPQGPQAQLTRFNVFPGENVRIRNTQINSSITGVNIASTNDANTAFGMLELQGQTVWLSGAEIIMDGAGPVTFIAQQAPVPPPAGRYRMYVDNADNKLKLVNSAGVVTIIGA